MKHNFSVTDYKSYFGFSDYWGKDANFSREKGKLIHRHISRMTKSNWEVGVQNMSFREGRIRAI